MRPLILSAVSLSFALSAFTGSAAAQTFPYDHIHLNVPDPAAAANWYEKNFGGRRIAEAPDRLMYGSTRVIVPARRRTRSRAAEAPSITSAFRSRTSTRR